MEPDEKKFYIFDRDSGNIYDIRNDKIVSQISSVQGKEVVINKD
jgi:hypothetical protein